MKSGTSFFNRGVFVKSVLRFWPIWAIYAFAQLLALPLNIIAPLSDNLASTVNRYVLEAVSYTAQYLCPAACCASAMAVFSHLYSDRASGFYSSLPISRGTMFTSLSLAGLVPLLSANLIIFFVSLAEEALFGFSGAAALLEWLGAVSLLTVAYFGIAALCAQLTGHIVVMPVLFIAFGVAVSWLGNMALVVPDMFCYGYASGNARISDLFSPFICLPENIGIISAPYPGVYHITGWIYMLAYGVLGMLLLPASCAMYVRHNVESAGDVVAIAPLRPVFQLICSFAAAFLLGNVFYTLPFGSSPADGSGQAIVYALCMSAAAFLGWFCAAMLVNKSFAVFSGVKRYIGWAVVSLLCAALVLSCELDLTGYETRLPEAGDVRGVRISAGGASAEFDEPANIASAIAVHESAISSREENEAARDGGYAGIYLYIDYELDNGGELNREYFLASDGLADTLDLLQELMNTTEGINSRKSLEIPMNSETISEGRITVTTEDGETQTLLELSSGEALELYRDCILPDMHDETIGLVWYRTDDAYRQSVYSCRIDIYARHDGGLAYSFYTVPTIWSERTNAWLTEHGIELVTLAEAGVSGD